MLGAAQHVMSSFEVLPALDLLEKVCVYRCVFVSSHLFALLQRAITLYTVCIGKINFFFSFG